jgi:glycosyltransferase involved in cell wall biosynthesis
VNSCFIDELEETKAKNKNLEQLLTVLDFVRLSENRVLLVTHELSRTGAPQALLQMARVLQKKFAVTPVVISPTDGPLRAAFEETGMHVIVYKTIFSLSYDINLKNFIYLFNIVIVNSMVSLNFIINHAMVCKHLYLWLHETEMSFNLHMRKFFKNYISQLRMLRFSVWCGSVYSHSLAEVFGKKGDLLLYCIDKHVLPEKAEHAEEMIFLIAGSIDARKGQHVFIKAVELLPAELRSKAKFYIIGSPGNANSKYAKNIFTTAGKFREIIMLPNMPLQELLSYYSKAHVLVSASFDDPMPIVVTYGLMFGMPCVVTDAVGHAAILKNGQDIDVVPVGDAAALSANMRSYIEHPEYLAKFGDSPCRAFDKYFSVQGFTANLRKLLGEEVFNQSAANQKCD